MGKLVYLMHLSLDGYVGRNDGSLDWVHMDDANYQIVEEVTQRSDTGVYGRKTFQMMDAYWPKIDPVQEPVLHQRRHAIWYAKANKLVFSKKGIDQVSDSKVTTVSTNILEALKQWKAENRSDLLMLGSPSIGTLLIQERLIDEYYLFINPVLIGEGIRLWPSRSGLTKLKLAESKVLESGVVFLKLLDEKV